MFRNNFYQRSKEVFSNTFWISPNNTPWAWRTPGISDRILIIILQLTQSILTCTICFKYLDLHYDETYQFLILDHFFSTVFFHYFLFFPDHFIWKHFCINYIMNYTQGILATVNFRFIQPNKMYTAYCYDKFISDMYSK